MSLIRYQFPDLGSLSPFDRLTSLRDEINRLFEATGNGDTFFGSWSPALDVYDNKDSFVVRAELPGMKKEEIDITLHDGVLTLSGERKHEHTDKDKEGRLYRSERYFGKFQRSVSLPSAVDANNVKASYKDGVLTVELPKTEDAKPKQITVSAE